MLPDLWVNGEIKRLGTKLNKTNKTKPKIEIDDNVAAERTTALLLKKTHDANQLSGWLEKAVHAIISLDIVDRGKAKNQNRRTGFLPVKSTFHVQALLDRRSDMNENVYQHYLDLQKFGSLEGSSPTHISWDDIHSFYRNDDKSMLDPESPLHMRSYINSRGTTGGSSVGGIIFTDADVVEQFRGSELHLDTSTLSFFQAHAVNLAAEVAEEAFLAQQLKSLQAQFENYIRVGDDIYFPLPPSCFPPPMKIMLHVRN